MVVIYGIKNCDTMKKARAWLDGRSIAYAFHDYKIAGVERAKLIGWSGAVGWERLSSRKAIELMLAHPSLIKRPVLEVGSTLLVGFDPASYAQALAAA